MSFFDFKSYNIGAIGQIPKIVTYYGAVHAPRSFSKEEAKHNFKDYYQVGFPTGINVWKSEYFVFSLEVVPFIRREKGQTKMSNLLFHPGLLIDLGKHFIFAGRLAFETSGRFGLTPVFSKSFKINEELRFFIATPLPVGFGNERPVTFFPGLLLGIAI